MKRTALLFAVLLVVTLIGGTLGGVALGRLGATPVAAAYSATPRTPLAPTGSGFTYQGQLLTAGSPATGPYDFQFTLYDAFTGGTPVTATLTVAGVAVTNGLFTTVLDFGGTAFWGEARYLELAVRPAGGGSYTILAPRQPLTPTPYALSAPWFGVSNKPPPYNPHKQANTITTLDSAGMVGQYTSITVGADGLGLISYYDGTNGDLKVAHCADLACATRTTATLDSTGDVGQYTSITLGSDDRALISYYDVTNGDLKVAHCADVACTSATTAALDSAGNVGQYAAITVASDGLGLISYYDVTNGDLKAAHCATVACTSAGTATLDGGGGGPDVGQYSAITVAGDGLGVISYYNATNSILKAAHCTDVACTASANVSFYLTDRPTGQYTSITVGSDGLPIIGFNGSFNGYIFVGLTHCSTFTCTGLGYSGTSTAADIRDTAITRGSDGTPALSYYSVTNGDLMLAHYCTDVLCYGQGAPLNPTTLDSAGDVGQYDSITIGSDGLALISYYDATNGDLKVIHLGSQVGVPYLRQR